VPRKRNIPVEPSEYKFRPVYLDPTYTEEKELREDIENDKFTLNASLVEMIELGWKISFSYSDHYNNYFISGSYKGSNHVALKRFTFISKHSDFSKAFGLLARYALVEVEDRSNYGVEDYQNSEW